MNAQVVDVQFMTRTPDGRILLPQETPDHPVVAVFVLTDPPGQHSTQGRRQESDWEMEEATWEDVEWQ